MKIFVIHAKKFQDRKKHIDRMLGALGLEAEYVCEGDVEELTSKVLNRYFNDNMIREGVRMNAPTMFVGDPASVDIPIAIYPRVLCTPRLLSDDAFSV